MPYKFRNPGPWGAGALEDLDSIDVDNNFWQAIQDIAAKSSQGVGIDNIVVSGSQFTVVLTDHTLLGPYQLPVVQFIFKGEWVHDYAYLGGSIVTHNGSTYFIPVNHVSETTFDPGANDGHGQNFYELLLQNPASVLPAGGPVDWVLGKVTTGDYVTSWRPSGVPRGGTIDQWLRKTGSGDYVFDWETLLLGSVSDVVLSSLSQGDLLQYNTSPPGWVNVPASSIVTVSSLNTLSDVNAGSPLDKDVLTWVDADGKWENKSPYSTASISGTSGTITVDPTLGDVQNVTITGNATLQTSSVTAGQLLAIVITSSGTSGKLLTFGSGFDSRGVMDLSTVDSKISVVLFAGYSGSYREIARSSYGNSTAAVALNPAPGSPIFPADGNVYTLTPNQNYSFFAGAVCSGQRLNVIITTSGTTSYNLTASTGFKMQGTLATGTVSGKTFALSFVCDGTNYVETSRTAAM